MHKRYNQCIKLPFETVDLSFRFINGEVASPTCKLSELLDVLLKPYLPLTPSYIRDAPDFLTKLPAIPREEVEDILLLSCDVTNMYPSITLKLGMEAIEYWVDKHQRRS